MSRFKNAWHAFLNKDSDRVEEQLPLGAGIGYSRPPKQTGYHTSRNSIIEPIYNRIGIDVSSTDVRHVLVDKDDRYVEDIDSSLNYCLQVSTNTDQPPAAFFRDVTMSLCEWGSVAIVPVETRGNPTTGRAYDILSLRVAQIVQFFAQHVRVRLYNDETNTYEELLLPKNMVAVVENPFYTVMNEPNSILQRLLRKLHVLDVMDEQNGAGKLDILIQLPYVLKTESKRKEAERRRKEIEEQLVGSKYGIAYIDGTERITQLNRAADNNVLAEVEMLTNTLYGQLGLTKEIVDGTADESAMVNYHQRTVAPFLIAITQSMNRTFTSLTARTQGHRIRYFRDPFQLLTVAQIAEIADKFTRNEIASSNELRTALGWKPSKDSKADELRNSNLSHAKEDPEMREIELARARKEIELMGTDKEPVQNTPKETKDE